MRFRVDILRKTVIICFVLLAFSTAATGVATINVEQNTPLGVVDYIETCYDPVNVGFANTPNGWSSLETTYRAVSLLVNHTDQREWTKGIRDALRNIVRKYSDMHDPFGGPGRMI